MTGSSGGFAGHGAVRAVLAVQRERFRSRLWPLPAAAVVVAVAVGVVLTRVDVLIDAGLSGPARTVVFNGDADTARSVLSAIAGAIVTATSLTFSLTVVAFQLASSQASPRLLRTFAKDGKVHATLAVFLGTFAYVLTVLRTVSGGTGGDPQVVPRLSITIGFLLALASVVTLVLFLAHLATQLRIETMLVEAHEDAAEAVQVERRELGAEPRSDRPVPLPDAPVVVAVRASGFISGVDRARLLRAAVGAGVRVAEVQPVGAFLVQHTPLLLLDRPVPPKAEARLRRAYTIDDERTAGQDYLFGVQQIVDVAVRALSPGVNDPTSAVHAIGHLSSLLVLLRGLPASPVSLLDGDGEPRLAPARVGFAESLRIAVTEIRRYGAGDADTAVALFGLLRTTADGAARVGVHEAVRAELELLVGSVAAADYAPPERARFERLAAAVAAALT